MCWFRILRSSWFFGKRCLTLFPTSPPPPIREGIIVANIKEPKVYLGEVDQIVVYHITCHHKYARLAFSFPVMTAFPFLPIPSPTHRPIFSPDLLFCPPWSPLLLLEERVKRESLYTRYFKSVILLDVNIFWYRVTHTNRQTSVFNGCIHFQYSIFFDISFYIIYFFNILKWFFIHFFTQAC